MVDRLRGSRKQLAEAARTIEREFLEVSGNLENLAQRGEDLLKGSEKLIELSLGKVEGQHLLHEVPALINKPVEFIATFNDEVRSLIKGLTDMDEATSTLLLMQTRLTDAFSPLRIIQVLYRIEAERLAEKDRRVFHALTAEMNRVEARMLRSFEEQFAMLSETRRQLQFAIQQLHVGVLRRDSQFRGKRDTIDQMIERVNHEVKLNEQRESRLTQTSRGLNQEINRVVMAIQHQDIVEQRLAHVEKAMAKLEDLLVDLSSADRRSRREKLAVIHSLSRLEQEQLQEVRNQFDHALAEIDGGIDKVSHTIKSVDTQCMSLNDFGHVTAAVDGMVQVLLDTLTDVSQLLQDTLTEADKTYEIIRPLGGQAAHLTDTVTSLSLAIKLIALNAQVQAGKLDNARTLEVLSARTSEIADDANHISLEVAGKLEAFSREMDRFVTGFETLRLSGRTEVGELNEQSVSAKDRLHSYRDGTLESLNNVGRMIERLNTLSGRRQNSDGFCGKLHHAIATSSELIESIIARIAAISPAGCLNAEAGGALEELMSSYTMTSERSVHERVIAQANPARPPTVDTRSEPVSAAVPAAGGGDGLGDNIELF